MAPDSERLQLLQPFAPWDGDDFVELPVLMKAAGKCTTDHISAAGPWLTFRGHLENISGNLFLGAVNAFSADVEAGPRQGPARRRDPPVPRHRPAPARGGRRLVRGRRRELRRGQLPRARGHGAPLPGGRAIFARSFARIHETNLKKQGVLALTFADPATYDAIGEDDTISVLGLADLAPDVPVRASIHKPDGATSTSRPPTP